jgi:hypothetical protein
MINIETRTSDAVYVSINVSRDIIETGMRVLGADRDDTLAFLGERSGAANGHFSQLLRSLQESQNLCFGVYGGLQARYEGVRSTLSDVSEYSEALAGSLRPNFSDFRELKHLLANAIVAAAENLRLNRGSSRERPEVYHEGAEERSSAQIIARRLRAQARAIQAGGPQASDELNYLARDLPAAASTLLSHVRNGQYGINHGIEEAVTQLSLATLKLLGTISLVDATQGLSALDWKRVKDDCSSFLSASDHPVLKHA